MVLVSHRYKFIYLKNYKVAGTSVESFFGQFCVDPSEPYSFEEKTDEKVSSYGIIGTRMVARKKWFNHKHAKEIKKDIGEEIFSSYLKFCVVRNPYDLMVSSYFWDLHLNDQTTSAYDFKTYCSQYHPYYNRSNVSRILLDGTPVCDVYLRYEKLKEDIASICKKLEITQYNIDDLPNHKSGIRPIKPYQEYYDEETKEIVSNLFKTEIEMFGYTF